MNNYVQLALNDDGVTYYSGKRNQYSFIERLGHWSLQERERSNGKMRDVVSFLFIAININMMPFI